MSAKTSLRVVAMQSERSPDHTGQRCGARFEATRRAPGGGALRMVPDLLLPLLLPSALILLLWLGCAVGEAQAQTPTQTTAQTTAQATSDTGIPTDASAAPAHSGKKHLLPTSGNVATSSLNAYLARVRAETTSALPTAGAIWTDTGRLTRMTTDVRAMRPNDLISVVVEESLAASTDGTVKNQRASTATSQISALIGLLHAGNALQNLLNQSSANSLNAQGASATNSSLTTTFGGQVIDVLPNGMLVIEAARQVEFSQQTQTIILRGLVRPEDISQQNQVLSTAISSLELEVKGKGIVNDYTRRQNPLVRWLQQILVF
ncbi:MAG TPA: flagellar basal body L-ring protein FlgH [Granulicella sp.]|nr:flagellar basal body L-ring protein FlgH [Granulicella sp.]